MSQQKDNLKAIITKITMEKYDARSPEGQRRGMEATLKMILGLLPLKNLRQLHHGITLAEAYTEPEEEQCPSDVSSES